MRIMAIIHTFFLNGDNYIELTFSKGCNRSGPRTRTKTLSLSTKSCPCKPIILSDLKHEKAD